MDGPHDLGGRQGFGPIKVDTEYCPFQTPWESRMWALSQTIGAKDWTIDWFRHLNELIDPADYLTFSYFEKWYMAVATGMVTSGVFTQDELISGKATERARPATSLSVEQILKKARGFNRSFERQIAEPPRFAVGDDVRTVRHGHSGHSRLPAYARGCAGVIVAHHGAYVFPDENVNNVEAPEHHYTVRFAATELWGPEASANDSVHIDAWESYLVCP